MNIFKKIAIFNKVTKIIKEIKKYFKETSIDEDMKDIILSIEKDFERLIDRIPGVKDAIKYLIGLIKDVK